MADICALRNKTVVLMFNRNFATFAQHGKNLLSAHSCNKIAWPKKHKVSTVTLLLNKKNNRLTYQYGTHSMCQNTTYGSINLTFCYKGLGKYKRIQ